MEHWISKFALAFLLVNQGKMSAKNVGGAWRLWMWNLEGGIPSQAKAKAILYGVRFDNENRLSTSSEPLTATQIYRYGKARHHCFDRTSPLIQYQATSKVHNKAAEWANLT